MGDLNTDTFYAEGVSSTKFNPCPFCGEERIGYVVHKTYAYAHCCSPSCGAIIETAVICWPDDVHEKYTVEALQKLWNRRK